MGEVVWTLVAEKHDELGMTHAYYRQVLRPSSSLAAALEETYVRDGVELAGADLGVHSAATGVRSIFGAQHRQFGIPLLPAVGRTMDAFEIAQDALALHPGFQAANWRLWPEETIAALCAGTRPLLATNGVPGHFRLVWQVPTIDVHGTPFLAILDGTNGTLIDVANQQITNTCTHQGTTQAAAIGVPEHDFGQPRRSLTATPGNAVPPYTHEAAWLQPGAGIPPIKLFIGLRQIEDGYFFALDCPGKLYGVFPVQPGKVGAARYQTHDFMDDPVWGGAAADAMYFTHLTMQTFYQDFGYFSYDNAGSEARIVINADHFTHTDTAAWNDESVESCPPCYHPPKSVSIYRTTNNPWHASAALDSVAHEWGHAVAFSNWNPWPYGGCDSVGGQLHEGFADIIGYYVERKYQPPWPFGGFGYEQSDWQFMEDAADEPKRRVDIDDHPEWYRYHRQDTTRTAAEGCLEIGGWDESHQVGNQLAVVFKLLAEGGYNPTCDFNPERQGCERGDVAAIGSYGAAKSFFRFVQLYASSSNSWDTIPDLVKAAAFDIYSYCVPGGYGYDAEAEQASVDDAFFRIGYSGITGYHRCN